MPKKESISDKSEASKSTTFIKKTSELLPIIGVDKGLFCMSDGSYMDIFRNRKPP